MLLSKALRITDSVTESVVSHLPGPLATPVTLAVSAATWVPRQVVGLHGDDHGDHEAAERQGQARPAESAPSTPPSRSPGPAAPEPEVVLSLDRPAEDLEPPIDVVGEALAAEAAEVPPAHADAEHVEVDEAVVFSTSTDETR